MGVVRKIEGTFRLNLDNIALVGHYTWNLDIANV